MPPAVLAENDPLKENEYKTYHSLGCMLTRECDDGVVKINSVEELQKFYPNVNFSIVEKEGNQLFTELERAGVNVYLADSRYFPVNHRGAYYTVGNDFFLNQDWMGNTNHFISVLRHEGWHAAQDCMAGTIDNNLIAVIHDDDEVPGFFIEQAKATYPDNVVPWEQEALWAGRTEGKTVEALRACNAEQPMWEIFEPTPLTRQYLIDEGYINE